MKRDIIRYAIMILALGIFSYSAYKLALIAIESKESVAVFDEVKNMFISDVSAGEMETDEHGKVIENSSSQPFVWDYKKMLDYNSEALGYIRQDDGEYIDNPIVQHLDNDYYLNHTWEKSWSSVGAIFLEQTSAPDFSDYHTLIYGHRMGNGSMFNSLHDFQDQAYWEAHPYIYIAAQDGLRRYSIFAAYEAETDSLTYQIGFPSQESKETFLTHCLDANVITTGLTPTAEDQILTLSTCTGRGHATRWVVQAILDGCIPP